MMGATGVSFLLSLSILLPCPAAFVHGYQTSCGASPSREGLHLRGVDVNNHRFDHSSRTSAELVNIWASKHLRRDFGRLRGGQRLNGITKEIEDSVASGPAGGEWLFAPASNEHGDSLTVIFHTSSGVCIEIDHEYSDGGISFCTTRGGPVFVYTSSNEIQRSEAGFGSPQLTCALSSGDLSRARSFSEMDSELQLGDWRRVGGRGIFTNSFFYSTLHITRTGGLLFMSNRLANKAFVVEEGEMEDMPYQQASELGPRVAI